MASRTEIFPLEPSVPSRKPYAWLPYLIIGMTIVALVIGSLVLHYIESRLVAASGQNLTLAAAEITDKLDRLLFERYGDVLIMAKAFGLRSQDPAYMDEYLRSMKAAYSPVYLWLGVVDRHGSVMASTDRAMIGRTWSTSRWFQAVRDTSKIHVGDVAPYEAVGGLEAVAFTAPLMGPHGEFLGAVTTRVGIAMLEDVLTQTIHAIEARPDFLGKIEYQFLTRQGDVFIDSDLDHKGGVNLKRLGLPSSHLSESGEPGYVEERHLRRHVDVVTGYAETKGYQDYKGLRWGVLVRMDRRNILAPVQSVLWKLGVAGAVVWVPMFGILLWATGRLRKEWVQTQQESARARAAEAARRESEERTRMIIETALDAVIVIDARGTILEWNAQSERLFGWSRLEVIGKPLFSTIISASYSEAHRRDLQHLPVVGDGSALNKRFEMTAGHRDGREFPVEVAISSAGVHDTSTFSAFVRDITEPKRAEQRLRVQHATTRVLADATTLKEAAAVILEAICEPLGWDLGILWTVDRQAKVLRCVDSWASPGVQTSVFETASRERTFGRGVGLPGRVWQTGEPAWIADIILDDNFPRVPMAAKVGLHGASAFPILLGNEVHGVLEFFSREIRRPDEHVQAMMAAIGNQVGHLIDRRQLEEQLRQSQKMEAIGRLAGGIAHDFNNLLTIILGYSHLALDHVSSAPSLREELEEIREAGERAAALTGQLLAFSRRQVLQPKVLDLNLVVKNLEKMLIRIIGEDVNLAVALNSSLGRIYADPGQIEQVVLNLAVNARDAMPKGGKMTIETDNVECAGASSLRHMRVKPGAYVRLTVSDTGCGMDEYTKSHLFEPFFTTKEQGKGTGLGLSTVYGIINQAGGEIMLDSEPGQGTTFTIYFPRMTGTPYLGKAAVAEVVMQPGTETVLLVEDQPAIRALVRDMLQRQGYTVLEARHGVEALMRGAQFLGTIDLLITDVVMPQMSGTEVAERLKTERPHLKVLFISGYTDEAIVHHGVLDGTVFLQKPFTPEALTLKVRQLLDRSGATGVIHEL